ncbi:hypothetical protein KDL01_20605 [Actinospica durhamensis]|uniref:Uncharacterized protein n=1 Tax=Actinospica durhamensis TaxID=1508375 RepID=A0A941EVB1_9ACTN|nr:hypothetical protein [Actinospica durhamensis]MBR7835689.1 hypothetical protein [Actinospica durhamensis]
MNTVAEGSGSSRCPDRARRTVAGIVLGVLGIALVGLGAFGLFFVAAVLYAAAKAGG